MSWEVDWSYPGNTGTKVWGRNTSSYIKKAREWHWVSVGYLREHGVNTPIYRKDSWEIDWSRRNGKMVWARNQSSKIPSARKWHWITHSHLDRVGISWKPFEVHDGRHQDSAGYVVLCRCGMTEEEIELAERNNLFRGARKNFVREHHLVAVQKYGGIPYGHVVRHLNGIKSDNRPENLVLGTTQENTLDHNTARLLAMYWREKYEEAQRKIDLLERNIHK